MLKRFLLLLALLLTSGAALAAPPSYDSDLTETQQGTTAGVTQTITFGSSAGGAYVLFVEIESEGTFWLTSQGTITYNGTAMTEIGSIQNYTGNAHNAYHGL